MRIPKVRDQVTLQMPAWNALYQIRDFSSHMMQVTAKDEEGHPLPLRKLDKQTWSVTANGTVTVSYPILWDEPGPFASQLNADHAFLNFAMVLLYVPDRRAEDTKVAFDDVPEGWRVAVELDAAGTAAGHHSGAYVAPSYDALVDAPVEIGHFDEFRMEAGGRPIRIVVHGDSGDRSRLVDSLKRIVDYDVSLMGGAPFREYLFLFHVGNNFGGGGMEHMNCTAISADVPAQLPSYSAHEFFHAWNVKRIRPQSLEPVDYTKEMWTRSLWFAEGVTNTYGAYALDAHGAVVHAAVLRQPGGRDQGAAVASRAPLAKRRAIEPRCVVRKISALHAPRGKHFVLQQGADRRRAARYPDPRPDRQPGQPG